MSATEPQHESTVPRNSRIPVLVLFAAAALLVTLLGKTAWVVLLEQGLLAVAVVAGGMGWGAWPVVWLGLGRRPIAQQVCLSVGLGLGVLAVLTLGLGLGGWLVRWTAWALVALGWAAGVARLCAADRHRAAGESVVARSIFNQVVASLLLLTLAVPVAIGLFAATLPPGMLWNGEARGYDVLEYHLQGPREHFDAGRIQFLPHNVYTSFPQQIEMLYLLLMHLAGGPLAGAIPAQLLHVAVGILGVVAVAAWTPPGWPRWIAASAAGSVPWLAYLGCLAYVEMGVLLMAALAVGLVLDQCRDGTTSKKLSNSPSPPWGEGRERGQSAVAVTLPQPFPKREGSYGTGCDWRTALAAGLCAGLACGCKYTAIVFIPASLAIAWGLAAIGSHAGTVRRIGLFIAGVVVAFSPWLVRNAAWTGNPVYPFGYRWFDGRAWSAEQDAQWERAHCLPGNQDSLAGRAGLVVRELLASRMFGPVLGILALVGMAAGRSRTAVLLALWAVLMVVAWAGLTHMPGRFIVPAVVPLALLAARVGDRGGATGWPRWPVALAGGLALAGGVVNNVTLTGVYHQHNAMWSRANVPLRLLTGATKEMAGVHPVRELLPVTGRVWLVGEARAFYLPLHVHYTVVFNRDPWLERARGSPAHDAVAWLRTQEVTHVVFSWGEIERLRASYGFPAWVTRDWVAELAKAGLRRAVPPAGADPGEIEVYEVPHKACELRP